MLLFISFQKLYGVWQVDYMRLHLNVGQMSIFNDLTILKIKGERNV